MVSGPSKAMSENTSSFVVTNQALTCNIQPLALMTILDAFQRRPKKESRAIGTLMGMVTEGGVLEIVDAFQVLHSDSAERGVLLDQNYHQKFVKLRQSVHPKEQVIGWFSVGEAHQLDESTQAIHEFYRKKESKFAAQPAQNFRDPVYLQVDTAVRDCATPIEIKAYTSDFVAASDQGLIHFYELAIASRFAKGDIHDGQEQQIVNMLSQACQKRTAVGEKAVTLASLDNFGKQLGELRELFTLAREYIKDVKEGKKPANVEVGRALSRALESELPDEQALKKLVTGASQDALMVRYLSSLCRTQILLAEKIQRILSATQNQDQ
ncbi:unnamed protein product [Amoebophrya sp. A25]|nr:unnamed protein product [Amoebophrya sp. A25]|eukprot:GSA25T00012876001.1